jgi:transposase
MRASMRPADAASSSRLAPSPRSVQSSKNGLDRAFLDETSDHQPLRHGTIRGQGYFH